MDVMKRFLVVLSLLALLVPAGAIAQSAKARVWISVQSPLTVRGSGFKSHERVTATVTASGARFVRSVTASSFRSLIARWVGSAAGDGGSVSVLVRAAGDRGSYAAWRSVANDCANGPTP